MVTRLETLKCTEEQSKELRMARTTFPTQAHNSVTHISQYGCSISGNLSEFQQPQDVSSCLVAKSVLLQRALEMELPPNFLDEISESPPPLPRQWQLRGD